jgi:hypothetical protein
MIYTYKRRMDGKIMHFDVVVADGTSHEKGNRIWKAIPTERRPRSSEDNSRRMPVLPYSTSSSLCREKH